MTGPSQFWNRDTVEEETLEETMATIARLQRIPARKTLSRSSGTSLKP